MDIGKRKGQIRQKMAILKIELNSNYGTGLPEVVHMNKIMDEYNKLKKELASLH